MERRPRDDAEAVVDRSGQDLQLDLAGQQVVDRLLADQAQEVTLGGDALRLALQSGKHIMVEKPMATTVEDWGKLLGDAAAATAMLDRILHHGHVLKCGPRSWRTKLAAGAEKWAIENEKVFL